MNKGPHYSKAKDKENYPKGLFYYSLAEKRKSAELLPYLLRQIAVLSNSKHYCAITPIVQLCHIIPCYAMLYHVMPCHTCYAM